MFVRPALTKVCSCVLAMREEVFRSSANIHLCSLHAAQAVHEITMVRELCYPLQSCACAFDKEPSYPWGPCSSSPCKFFPFWTLSLLLKIQFSFLLWNDGFPHVENTNCLDWRPACWGWWKAGRRCGWSQVKLLRIFLLRLQLGDWFLIKREVGIHFYF